MKLRELQNVYILVTTSYGQWTEQKVQVGLNWAGTSLDFPWQGDLNAGGDIVRKGTGEWGRLFSGWGTRPSFVLWHNGLGKHCRGGLCRTYGKREWTESFELHLEVLLWACTLGRFLRYGNLVCVSHCLDTTECS